MEDFIGLISPLITYLLIKRQFKPTAGKMPPVLVGREKVTDDFLEGAVDRKSVV